MTGWRPALRIARRSVRRSPGRSLLVAVLVGLPVAGATGVDVLARSLSSGEREARRAMGPADARLVVTPWTRLAGYRPAPYSAEGAAGRGAPDRDPARVDVTALLPAGSRVLPVPTSHGARVPAGSLVLRPQLVVADPRDPLHGDEARLEAGRAPRTGAEALVTPALAERLGDLRPGGTVTLADGSRLAVTGIARARHCLSCDRIVVLPGSPVARAAQAADAAPRAPAAYLVDLPPGADPEALWPALAARGAALEPRAVHLEPERFVQGGEPVTVDALRAAALVALIVGLGLLEVVLLAGTAFAVGARRQTRELGLVAASGGSPRDVRRIVLAQGLVLGGLGAGLGVVVGAALVVAARPLWERLDDGEIVAWAFGPWEIAAAALVGLLSGLAAAVVPALGAGRMAPVDALAGRFRSRRRARRRAAATGGVLAVAGAALALTGDRLLADDFAAYERVLAAVPETGVGASAPTPAGPVALILAGAALLAAALVVLAPAALGRLAGVAARLPLSPRLALRDAARHRHRTGPATSAVAVAVAGFVALAFLAAGAFRAAEAQHVPTLPAGVISVLAVEADPDSAMAGARVAAARLPGARWHVERRPLRPAGPGEAADDRLARELFAVPAADGPCTAGCQGGSLAIAGPPGLDDLTAGGRLDAAARSALAAGRAVAFDEGLVDARGRLHVEVGWDEAADAPRIAHLPAHVAERRPYTDLPAALVPPALARAQGWEIAPARALVAAPQGTDPEALDTAMAAVEGAGAMAFREEPPAAPERAILLGIAGIAGFVTLAGVAISVALSAAEGRADLATLAAVGAPPTRRRALAASQALVVGGLGCVLGLAAGAFVAYTARATTGAPEWVVPWVNLAATGIAVPLLAVLVAAAFTPSRLPLARRVT